jgi:SAM-dependent methyltransferase
MSTDGTMEPRGEELIRRYRANYRLADDCVITEEMVLKHWELERRLRRKLLESTPANRWDVFDTCYTELYGTLSWLSRSESAISDPLSVIYENWLGIIGSPPMRVYEVGSGGGQLISYLASCRFYCRATEITRERGSILVPTHPNLSWGISDGIHLDRFERRCFYDVVISNQVIEHLHPDDLLDHFRGAISILSDGGRCILSTPHVHAGPSDVSRVFRREVPMGMHLKEYTYTEIERYAKQAGFNDVYAVIGLPVRIRRMFRTPVKPKRSRHYMIYLRLVEAVIGLLPTQDLRRMASKMGRLVLFAPNIMVILKK